MRNFCSILLVLLIFVVSSSAQQLEFSHMYTSGNASMMLNKHAISTLRQIGVPVYPDARDGIQVMYRIDNEPEQEVTVTAEMVLKDGTRITASRTYSASFKPATPMQWNMHIVVFDYGEVERVVSVAVERSGSTRDVFRVK